MLVVNQLNQYYGGSHTLRDISFTVPQGACTTLLGRNGVGKSTLLKCLMGVLPMASGTLSLAGRDISRASTHQRARLGMAYVPQGREIFARLSIEENLLIATAAHGDASGRFIPAEIYDMFPVLKDMLHRRGGDLSGGQQQQLAIARALMTRPKLLILDEPTEGIQPSIIKDIEKVIRHLMQRGEMTLLLVEQYYDFAKSLADHYLVMARGEIIKSGLGSEMESEQIHSYLAV